MDNKEAKQILQFCIPMKTDKQREAINLAIEALQERPQGECKTCRYYHPYYEQFSNEPRGDGYCVIARMTSEGMTTINCNDEFSCSDYRRGEE
jgi:hypothetical protein